MVGPSLRLAAKTGVNVTAQIICEDYTRAQVKIWGPIYNACEYKGSRRPDIFIQADLGPID